MRRRLSLAAVLIAATIAAGVCGRGLFRAAESRQTKEQLDAINPADDETSSIGAPLYPPATSTPAPRPAPRPGGGDPVVVPECRLAVFEKQDVPSQREGVVLFVGTEVEPGEAFPAEMTFTARVGDQQKLLRRLKEGDVVKAGQLLAYLDDQLSRDEWAIKNARVAAGRAELQAALKTAEESKNRYETLYRLWQESRGATSEEDVRAAKLAWDRGVYEVAGKREAVTLAERELSQAETVLRMHQIRSARLGVIKAIYKKPGEAVKALEPVVQVHDLSRLRAEGLVDVQFLPRLRAGLPAVVEPCVAEGPRQMLIGHFQEVTGVAVSKDSHRPLVVSASEDGTVRVWDRATGRECRTLRHPAAVLCVACSPPGATLNRCLSGAADGVARIWDLDVSQEGLVRELGGQHAGAVTAVAFSPDGRSCVTGGEDRDICLWDVDSGELRYRLPAGHRGAVTALQFRPQAGLVSAGRDNTLRLWALGEHAARLEATIERRSGDVAQVGASHDGRFVLYDEGSRLRLLTLPEGVTEGALENTPAGTNFTTLALFSPDGRLVVTAAEGRLQVWQAPVAGARARELRQLVLPGAAAATCAAFAPDGSFLVAGTRERQVLIWPVPGGEGIEQSLPATVTLVEHAEESSTRQVRIWAEVANPQGRLVPGTAVTLCVWPD